MKIRFILLLIGVSFLAACSSPNSPDSGTVWHQKEGGAATLTLYRNGTALFGPIPASYGTFTVDDSIYKVDISQVYPGGQANSEWYYTLIMISPDTLRGIDYCPFFQVSDSVSFWK